MTALGLVSLLTDASSEAIYPILPLFLTTVIGAPVAAVGLIESIAEATASFVRVFSGWISDRIGRRKPLVVAGYTLSNLAKPLLALTATWPAVLVLRFTDRFGKGIRTAPRDALIADSGTAATRGRDFGWHRALDTIGAAIGPLVAWAVLTLEPGAQGFRTVFLISAIPGTLAIALVFLLVREVRRHGSAAAPETPASAPETPPLSFRGLGRPFAIFAVIGGFFALGNSSDAMLVLRARDVGVATALIPLAYFVFNVVAALLATPFGHLSDRVGRRPVLVAGFAGYALVYAGFALAGASWHPWLLFAAYGIPYAATEGLAKAYVVDLVPRHLRATAVGAYTFVLGMAAMLSSSAAGLLWQYVGHGAPFLVSAALMGIAAIGLALSPGLRAGDAEGISA